MAGLREFVLDLSRDPHKVDALKADPDGVLDATSLSDEEKRLVKSGDVAAITSALSEGRHAAGDPIVFVVVVDAVASQ